MPDLSPFDAVVVAGGGATRLGGTDKAELVFEGIRLIDRVVDAVEEADLVVGVGPPRPTERPVVWTREQPIGGGPVAALAAGLALVCCPRVVVVAVDLPLLGADLIRKLVLATNDARGAVAVDADGNNQPLLACYPTSPLRRAIGSGSASGRSMMALLDELEHVAIEDEGRSRDCDTLQDIDDLGIERGR